METTEKTSTSYYLGREIKTQKEFKVSGTFKSLWAAEGWLKDNGYSYGSLCGDLPVAIKKKWDYEFPQKWKNFTAEEKGLIDGVMVSRDFREGSVSIILFKNN
tara:strand:- start:2037 stop:2345 length:309 start_codon:yes stop_codon:yes gene_type:complete